MAKQGKDWLSYDGRVVEDGQVLVPQMVTPEYARDIGADMRNLRTWEKAGVSFTVMFIPVASEMEEEAWRVFNSEENELLGEKLGMNRNSRCMIPQQNGHFTVCPKVRKCTGCPDRGKYGKEDRSLASLDDLSDDNYFPAEAIPSAESEAMVGFLLEELVADLGTLNPLYEKVIRMLYQGMSRKEVIAALPVQQSRAYELLNQCQQEVEKWLRR